MMRNLSKGIDIEIIKIRQVQTPYIFHQRDTARFLAVVTFSSVFAQFRLCWLDGNIISLKSQLNLINLCIFYPGCR